MTDERVQVASLFAAWGFGYGADPYGPDLYQIAERLFGATDHQSLQKALEHITAEGWRWCGISWDGHDMYHPVKQ